jgi:uncharacterized phage protein (TIGR01671 family)
MRIRYVYKSKKKVRFSYGSTSNSSHPVPNGYKLCAVNKSTGLKDKNKKEIYEGDVFLPVKSPYPEYTHYRPSFIYYDSHYAAFRLMADEDEDGIELNKHVYKQHMAVAGNVYENPELLASDEDIGLDMLKAAKQMTKDGMR